MDIILCLFVFVACWAATGISLGTGISTAIAVGYFNGLIRGNLSGSGAAFVFESAVLGIYLREFTRPVDAITEWQSAPMKHWVILLAAWPTLLLCVPVQNIFIQLIGYRAAVFFLPILLMGARLTPADLLTITWAYAILNPLAFGFGVAEYFLGIARFFQENAATRIIFGSHDVGAGEIHFHRIPATFLNAHAYGGTMLLSMPLLINRAMDRLVALPERIWMIAVTLTTAMGIFMCGARAPVVMLAMVMAIYWLLSRFSATWLLIMAGGWSIVLWFVSIDSRFQRAYSLSDTDYLQTRVAGSVNQGFFDLLLNYPLGAGLGRAVGTSVPAFLQGLMTLEPVGAENEYAYFLVEQGWIGLALWMIFLIWNFARFPRGPERWENAYKLAFAVGIACWGTSFIGTGATTSIPGTLMIFLYMGMLTRKTAEVVAVAPEISDDGYAVDWKDGHGSPHPATYSQGTVQ